MADGAEAGGDEAGGDDAAKDEAANEKKPNDLGKQQPSKKPKKHLYTFEEFKKVARDIMLDTKSDGDVYHVVQDFMLDLSDVPSHAKQ